jgi:PAS domain-containing protein
MKSNQGLLHENQELHRRLQELEELLAKSHKAEDALKDECDFNSALLDTLGALVVVLDREGRIIRFNRACEQTTGCLFQEVQGKAFFDLFLLPEEVQGVKETFQK